MLRTVPPSVTHTNSRINKLQTIAMRVDRRKDEFTKGNHSDNVWRITGCKV